VPERVAGSETKATDELIAARLKAASHLAYDRCDFTSEMKGTAVAVTLDSHRTVVQSYPRRQGALSLVANSPSVAVHAVPALASVCTNEEIREPPL